MTTNQIVMTLDLPLGVGAATFETSPGTELDSAGRPVEVNLTGASAGAEASTGGVGEASSTGGSYSVEAG